MTVRKVSTSGTRGIGDGMLGVELLLASLEDHLAWHAVAHVDTVGLVSTLSADCMRIDLILGSVELHISYHSGKTTTSELGNAWVGLGNTHIKLLPCPLKSYTSTV